MGPAGYHDPTRNTDHRLGAVAHRGRAACAPTAALIGHRSPLGILPTVDNHRSLGVESAPLLVRDRQHVVVRALPVGIKVLPTRLHIKAAAFGHELIQEGPGALRIVVAIAEEEQRSNVRELRGRVVVDVTRASPYQPAAGEWDHALRGLLKHVVVWMSRGFRNGPHDEHAAC